METKDLFIFVFFFIDRQSERKQNALTVEPLNSAAYQQGLDDFWDLNLKFKI